MLPPRRTGWCSPAVALNTTPASRQEAITSATCSTARHVRPAAAQLDAPADRGDRADRGRNAVAPALVEHQLEVDLDARAARSAPVAAPAGRTARGRGPSSTSSTASTPSAPLRQLGVVRRPTSITLSGGCAPSAAPRAARPGTRTGRASPRTRSRARARSSASASSSDMLAGGNSAAWSIRRSSTCRQSSRTRARRGCRARCRRCRRPSAPRPCGRRRSRAPTARAWPPGPRRVQRSSPSSSSPRQSRTNAFDSHSSPIGGRVGVAGVHARLGGSFISTSMIECFRSSKLVEPGARTPPTEPLKSVSPVNTSVAVHDEVEHPGGVARACAATRSQAAHLAPSRPARSCGPPSISCAASIGWARISTPCRSFQTDVLGHVVAVVVGEEQQLARRARAARPPRAAGPRARPSRSPRPCRPPRRRRGRRWRASPAAWSAR